MFIKLALIYSAYVFLRELVFYKHQQPIMALLGYYFPIKRQSVTF